MIRFNANPDLIIAEAGDADRPARIGGIAVPWDVTATVSDGTQVKFERGAFDTTAKKAKLVENHDLTQLRGTVEVSDGPDGLEFVATFANTAAARDAIELVKAGAYDSVSVGANPTKFKYDKDGVLVVSAADLVELSLVAVPAFSQAVITEIAASNPDADDAETPAIPEEETMSEDIQAEAVEAPVTATAPIWAQPKKLRLPSPGEYILAMKRGGADFAQLNANIQAATGDVLVSDAAGVIPTPIIGGIFQDIQGVRPVVSALGPKAMPESGASFIRPWVKVHSAVGEQSTELAALSTADFEIDDLVISKKTFGGKLVLSEQVIDWSAPSMLDAAISDMAIKYALATEKETIDTIAAAVTNTQEVINTTSTSASEFISDLYTAAAGIAGTGNFLPNVLVVSPAKWAVLGSLVDGQNRPLFPQAAPMNSVGTLGGVVGFNGNPLGLQLVVSNQVGSQAVGNKTATEYYWLMNSRGVEVYEQYKGFLRDESPANLSVTVATRGYFAAKVIDVNMIRIIGPDATF